VNRMLWVLEEGGWKRNGERTASLYWLGLMRSEGYIGSGGNVFERDSRAGVVSKQH
jgi:hypothetical protein